MYFRHQLSRYLTARLVVSILVSIHFNHVYCIHCMSCSTVSWYHLSRRCAAAVELVQLNVVFATPRGCDVPSPLLLESVNMKEKKSFFQFPLL